MGFKWRVFLIGPMHLIGMLFNEAQRAKHRKDTCTKEIGPPLQISTNYSTFNSDHHWDDLCIQSRNQQTCTSNNYN